MSICLSVNLNKIALIRNSRAGDYPGVTEHARLCVEAGADGITVHPRPDQRHIRASDVPALAAMLTVELNVEGNPFAGPARSHRADVADYPGFMALVRAVRPPQCTLVPDSDAQLTSDHGFDLARDGERLRPLIGELRALGIRVSLFMDPDPAQIRLAAACGADRVELYTGPYAAAFAAGADPAAILRPHIEAARAALDLGLGVNAGHDLNLLNLGAYAAAVPGLQEVSIGHAFTVDALRLGIAETVRAYQRCLGQNGLSESTHDAFSAGFSVCDCDRYAEHLADISVRRRMVVASDDVRNQFGVLLLARGAPLGRFAFGRMRGHRLNRPVDEALAMRRCLDTAALATRLRELLDSAPDLQRIAVASGLAPRLEALCETAALGPVLLQKLSVLEEVLPAVFRRALFCACFGVLLAGERRLDATEARLLFQAGLLHDLGLLHIDPALATRNAGIGPAEWREIQRHVPISAAIAERLAAAPARLARVIRGHHERADGTGYPAGSTHDDIDPLAQILALCDMLHALRFHGSDTGTLADCMPYLRVNRHVFGEQNYRAAGRILAGARGVAPPAAPRALPRQLLLDTNRSLVALRGSFATLRALLRQFPADPLPASVQRLVEQFERISDASGLGLEACAPALGESIGADTGEAGLLEIQRTAQELFWLVRRIERQLRALAGASAAGASQRMLRELAHGVEFELGRAWQRFEGASAPRQERSDGALTPLPLRASLPRR